jgi:Sec7-like guanine-nucleotide exchange factor
MSSVSNGNKRFLNEEQSLRKQGLEGIAIILRTLLRTANLWHNLGEFSQQNTPTTRRDSISNPYSVIASLSFDEQELNRQESNAVVDIFDKKQKLQEEIELGILKFNLSPKAGLKYLAELGHLTWKPQNVAQFLRQYQNRLDKASIGDFLGREREYENGDYKFIFF